MSRAPVWLLVLLCGCVNGGASTGVAPEETAPAVGLGPTGDTQPVASTVDLDPTLVDPPQLAAPPCDEHTSAEEVERHVDEQIKRVDALILRMERIAEEQAQQPPAEPVPSPDPPVAPPAAPPPALPGPQPDGVVLQEAGG